MTDRDSIMDVLRTIPDPEMPISIVDLGLVEDVRISTLPPGQGPGVSATGQSEPLPRSQLPLPQLSGGPVGRGSQITIDLLPTFIGCPALEMIAGDVRARVSRLPGVDEVRVNWLFDPPWTVDRITPGGRASLKEHGVTVPTHGSHLHVPAHDAPETVTLRTSAIPCPFCGSTSTYLDSPFGPTRCRTIYYCESCRNSFEHMKRV